MSIASKPQQGERSPTKEELLGIVLANTPPKFEWVPDDGTLTEADVNWIEREARRLRPDVTTVIGRSPQGLGYLLHSRQPLASPPIQKNRSILDRLLGRNKTT